jgi:Ca2+-binding EF-hand superfamily protein
MGSVSTLEKLVGASAKNLTSKEVNMSISGISGLDSYYYLSQLSRQSGSSSSSSASSIFSSIDTSGDGSISQGDLTAILSLEGNSTNSVTGSGSDSTASLVQLLEDAGQLDSATGTTAAADQLFNAIDTSGSGSISKTEFETFVSNLASESGSGTSAMSAPPPPPPQSSDSTSALESLLQSLETGLTSSTDGTTASSTSTSSATSTGSTTDQTNSGTAFLAQILEAIGKYMLYGQTTTSTSSGVNVTG